MEHKYTDEELVEIIDMEGLDYSVQYYLSADKIESAETAALWVETKIALTRLQQHLGIKE